MVLASSLFLAACSSATPTGVAPEAEVGEQSVDQGLPLGEAKNEPEPTATYSPRQLAVCAELASDLAASFGLDVGELVQRGVPWVDLVDQAAYMGCEVAYNGPGAKLGLGPVSYMAPAHTLRAVLEASGRQEDLDYAADGPGASIFGYRSEEDICTASVSFRAPDGADCAGEDPTTCGLPPEEQIYDLKLTCALFSEAVGGEVQTDPS